MVHMPLFKVILPPICMQLVSSIISIATFDIPYINLPDINWFLTGGNTLYHKIEEVDHAWDKKTMEDIPEEPETLDGGLTEE